MSELEVFRRIIIRDRNGKVKFDSGLEPSNSFVIAFIQHVYGAFNSVNLSMKDTAGAMRTIRNPTANYVRMHVNAGDNSSAFGIVVGTGTTAEDNEDYKLDTQIAHGTGAGQLDYGTHSFTAPSVVGDNVDMIVSRSYYNGSGASITVREIGIYCKSYDGAGRYLCILRDVLSTPGVVGNTETLTVQYTFRTTV